MGGGGLIYTSELTAKKAGWRADFPSQPTSRTYILILIK